MDASDSSQSESFDEMLARFRAECPECVFSTTFSKQCSLRRTSDDEGPPVQKCAVTRQIIRHCPNKPPESVHAVSEETSEPMDSMPNVFSLPFSIFGRPVEVDVVLEERDPDRDENRRRKSQNTRGRGGRGGGGGAGMRVGTPVDIDRNMKQMGKLGRAWVEGDPAMVNKFDASASSKHASQRSMQPGVATKRRTELERESSARSQIFGVFREGRELFNTFVKNNFGLRSAFHHPPVTREQQQAERRRQQRQQKERQRCEGGN